MNRGPGYELDEALRRLHLPTVRRLYPGLITEAEKSSWTYRELLEQLFSEEIAHRQETRIQRASRGAKFPFLKTIEEFDFEFQKSVQRVTLGRYLGPELVSEGRCAVFQGLPGRGKTHLGIAIAYKAIQNGFSARFTTTASLLNALHKASLMETLDDTLAEYIEPDVLLIDELGYLAYGPDAANGLFQVIDSRYLSQKPVLITTNKEVTAKHWGAVLHDTELAAAIIDRLLERGEVICLRGKSYRNRKGEDVEVDEDPRRP